MEPAWTQFESTQKSKVNIAFMNVDEKSSPEMMQYGKLLQKSGGSIPYTAWLDSKGHVLDQQVGLLDLKHLDERTLAAERKAH
jgi:hypothetical protein